MFRNKVRLLYPNQNKARKKKGQFTYLNKVPTKKNKEKSGKKNKEN